MEENDLFTIDLAIRLRRRGSELKLVLADRAPPVHRDRRLIGILALGFLWFEELRTGAAESIAAIAEREKVSPRLVRRYCDLAFLGTDLVEAILVGEQPVELTSESFKQAYPLPITWEGQRRSLALG